MAGHPDMFLQLGGAFVFIALAAVLAHRVKFSVIPFLILAGMLVGPHAPAVGSVSLAIVTDTEIIEFFGRLGILFLLMFLGLEYSLDKLLRAGPSIAWGGLVYVVLNFGWGVGFGALLGWSPLEILVLAGITTISSSAIVAKTLVDLRRTANPETEMILGIIMFEDVFLALYLAVMSGLVLAGQAEPRAVALAVAQALVFVGGILVVGRKMGRAISRALDIESDEIFLIVVMAVLLVVVGFGERVHVAEAIGALMVGLVLSETAQARRIEHLIMPLRDIFGAVFFFFFGLGIDHRALGGAAGIAVAAVVLTVIGNMAAGMMAGRLRGLSPRRSANIGLTIVSRGEFSIVVASLAKTGGLSPIIQPFAALYVVILAVFGPLLTRESQRIYGFFERLRHRRAGAQASLGQD